MKHLSQDKYTIAWFKLAECVSRGEKERAFGVYRLLSHSIDNHAFACQLQGDLHFSFDDVESAIAKYFDAAHLYEAEERFLEAAAVYENLLSLRPTIERYRERIIALYQRLNIPSKVLHHRMELIEQCMNEHKFKEAQAHLAALDDFVAPELVAAMYEKFIVTAIENGDVHADQIEKNLKALIDIYLTHELNKRMRQFLSKLEVVEPRWHEKASSLLKG